MTDELANAIARLRHKRNTLVAFYIESRGRSTAYRCRLDAKVQELDRQIRLMTHVVRRPPPDDVGGVTASTSERTPREYRNLPHRDVITVED